MTKEKPLQRTLQEWTTLTPEAPVPNVLQLLGLFSKLNLSQNVSEVWLLAKGPLGKECFSPDPAPESWAPQLHIRHLSRDCVCHTRVEEGLLGEDREVARPRTLGVTGPAVSLPAALKDEDPVGR